MARLITIIILLLGGIGLPAYALDSDGNGVADVIEASTGADPKSKYAVSVRAGHACAIDNSGVKCWGRSDFTNVPPLSNPRMISVGGEHACALDDLGVTCWGSNAYGQTSVPPLTNPRYVATSYWNTCAIDDSGVKCWGWNGFGMLSPPPLPNPVMTNGGGYFHCALLGAGAVSCWGQNNLGQLNPPTLVNPLVVTSGGDHSCAIDETGLKCWGSNRYGQISPPPLADVQAVAAGGIYYERHPFTCAIADGDVSCWGLNDLGQTDVPNLQNPVAISTGVGTACALDDTGVVCWGNNSQGQTDVPPLDFTQLRVSIVTDDVLECSLPNAATANAVASVSEDPDDPVVLIEWLLNGISQGYGSSIEVEAPLGSSTLSVEATTQSGRTATDAKLIVVEDTTPPDIAIHFVNKDGNSVQSITKNGLHALTISLTASDVCDPEVVATGTGGIDVVDGLELSIHATLDEVTVESNIFQVEATAEDDTGNTTIATKALSVVD